MAMLITSIAKIRAAASPEGFSLCCREMSIDPDNYTEPEYGVMVSEDDLYRYSAATAAQDLRASVNAFIEASLR
jgi:predicted HicB family RNase H-like nuclease